MSGIGFALVPKVILSECRYEEVAKSDGKVLNRGSLAELFDFRQCFLWHKMNKG